MILFLRFFLSFSFDLDDITNTQDSVWPHFQTLRIASKILRCALYFQLSSLDMSEPTKGNVLWYISNL